MMSRLASKYSFDTKDNVWIGPEFSQLAYSDGDEVERKLYDAIAAAKDVGTFSAELSRAITDWPTWYHLSPVRANLLRPFAEILSGRTLELGAGCGPLTRYMGELNGELVAVEGSRNRARIAALRCRDLANVSLVCDRIETFEADAEFDAVTLIGVLEYARVFSTSQDPVREILLACRRLLSPQGRLILAIENQLGLKYFAGALEDHALVAMHGINDTYDQHSIVTFGRSELESIIRSCGFEDVQFCAPLPDYKLPTTVVLPRGLTQSDDVDLGGLFSQSGFSDHQKPEFPLFSLEQAWRVVGRNRLLTDLANSFLIVASPERLECLLGTSNRGVIARHYSSARRPEFCQEVVIAKSQSGLVVNRSPLIEHRRDCQPIRIAFGSAEYAPGEMWWDRLGLILNRPGWAVSDIVSWAEPWVSILRVAASGVGLDSSLPNNYIDATPFNLVRDRNDAFRFFDLEWKTVANPTLGHVVFRGLYWSIVKYTSVAPPVDPSSLKLMYLIESVIRHSGFNLGQSDLRRYVELESMVAAWTAANPVALSFTDLVNTQLVVRESLELRTDSARMQAQARASEAKVAEMESQARASEAKVAEMESQASVREAKVAEMESQASAREANIAEMESQASAREANIAKMESQASAREATIAAMESQARARELRIVEMDARAKALQAKAAGLDSGVRGLQAKVAGLEAELTAERGQGAAYLKDATELRNSISWRLTKPIRILADAFLWLRQIAFRLLYGSAAFAPVGKAIAKAVCVWPIPGGRWMLPSVPLFLTKYYADSHPDVRAARDLCAHYVGFGADEGRNPHPLFDTKFYLATNPDVASSGVNPLLHYWMHGDAEGRRPNPDFDPSAYLAQRPDLRQSGVNLLLHYREHGRYETPPAVAEQPSSWSSVDQEPPCLGPLISLLLPTFNTPPNLLRLAIDSVRRQTYTHWQLCIHDDGSSHQDTLAVLREYAALKDHRILMQYSTSNRGISEASNAALVLAQGDFVGMLDHDDELEPEALAEVVKLLAENPALDVVYTDQDYTDIEGRRTGTLLKPDWSPEMFRGVMFVNHLLVVRATLMRGVGAFDPAFNRIQDFEFMLRVAEATGAIGHVPRILYHWRAAPGSVASGANAKGLLEPLQAAAVNAHLARCGIPAVAAPHPSLSHRLTIQPARRSSFPRVTVALRDVERASAGHAVSSILEHSSYPNLIVAVPQSLSHDLPRDQRIVVRELDEVHRQLAPQEFLVWMNADLEVVSPNWIEILLLYCEQKDIACAAPVIVSQGVVDCAGLVLGMDGGIGRVMKGWPLDSDGYAGSLSCSREVSAASGECMMISGAMFTRLGGGCRYYASSTYDGADLALRGSTIQCRNIVTPRAVVKKTAALAGPPASRLDEQLFADRWKVLIGQGDPFYNRNFLPEAPGYCLENALAGSRQ